MSSNNNVEVGNSRVAPKSKGRRIFFRVKCVKRFSRDQDGAMAVEFAILSLPFIGTLFAIFEAALMFSASQMLDTGINTAARMIRTGQVQAQSMDATAFKNLVCANIPGMLDCANGLKVDVRSFPNFGNISLPPATDDDGELKEENFTFLPGNPSEVVVVRAYYSWQLLFPGQFSGLSNMGGNKRLLASAATFRNEPFESVLNP